MIRSKENMICFSLAPIYPKPLLINGKKMPKIHNFSFGESINFQLCSYLNIPKYLMFFFEI